MNITEFANFEFNAEVLGDELAALNIAILGFGRRSRRWDNDGIMTLSLPYIIVKRDRALTANQIVRVQQVFDNHIPPTPLPTIRERYDNASTDTERLDILSEQL